MQEHIVACARSWIGTRFHHQGRLKKTEYHKGGVDCLGLLIGVANELKLPLAYHDENSYSHYPDTDRLKTILSNVMSPIAIEQVIPGDILLLNVDGNPQHLAIAGMLNEVMSMVHAYAPARGVVEHSIDRWWQQRIVAAFRIILPA